MLELVPPGRVIFLRPLKTKNVRTSWDAVWVKAEEVIREVSCYIQSPLVWLSRGALPLACTPASYPPGDQLNPSYDKRASGAQ